jgi:hypothetical protein
MRYPKTRYVLKTLHHKWHVFRFGLQVKAPLFRLIIHDWTKFTPYELPAYAQRFYGDTKNPRAFAQAWNHHSKSHPHHWEWWIPVTSHVKSESSTAGRPLPMPEWAVREMVADWLGASASYEGKVPSSLADWEWYQKDRPKMRLHADTVAILDKVLAEFFERRSNGRP